MKRLRSTFESVAEGYHAARPPYPAELFGDLVRLADLAPHASLLEIGCGTGKATRPLLERGYRVTCVELGARLAEEARRNLSPFPVVIHVAPFESWPGPQGEFDLVYAATAWHWIPASTRYSKAHGLLRPGGSLAFWSAFHAFPPGFDPFFGEIQDVYAALGCPWEGAWPPPRPEEIPDEREQIEATGLFRDVAVRRYVWEVSYTADQYVALLGTFSGHIEMESWKQERLYEAIRARVVRRAEPRIRRHWHAILHVARRVDA